MERKGFEKKKGKTVRCGKIRCVRRRKKRKKEVAVRANRYPQTRIVNFYEEKGKKEGQHILR